jgi:hypothetical protein
MLCVSHAARSPSTSVAVRWQRVRESNPCTSLERAYAFTRCPVHRCYFVASFRAVAGPLHRIAPESFLVGGWRIVRPQSTRKVQMKTILMMLIVGLMLAGCGSMENHVRNVNLPAPLPDPGDTIAVDTICACP